MKTGEMYMTNLVNPRSTFIRSDGENCRFSSDGCLYNLKGNYPRKITADEEWELVRKPVDFMTAVNSGKRIQSNRCLGFHPISWYLEGKGRPTLEEVNGKWLIE